jgi:hypothetical protein
MAPQTPNRKPELNITDDRATPTRSLSQSLSQRPGSIYERERVKKLPPVAKKIHKRRKADSQIKSDAKKRVKKKVPNFDSLAQEEQDRLVQDDIELTVKRMYVILSIPSSSFYLFLFLFYCLHYGTYSYLVFWLYFWLYSGCISSLFHASLFEFIIKLISI